MTDLEPVYRRSAQQIASWKRQVTHESNIQLLHKDTLINMDDDVAGFCVFFQWSCLTLIRALKSQLNIT